MLPVVEKRESEGERLLNGSVRKKLKGGGGHQYQARSFILEGARSFSLCKGHFHRNLKSMVIFEGASRQRTVHGGHDLQELHVIPVLQYCGRNAIFKYDIVRKIGIFKEV